MNDSQIIYEPRALWDVQAVTPLSSPITAETRAAFNKENLRNGTRNPITITKMLLAPVGYTLNEYDGNATPPATAADYDSSASAMQKCKIFVTSPGRQNFMYRPQRMPSLGSLAIDDVSMRNSGQDYASGLHNVVKWDFDKPMIIPRGTIAEFQLGSPALQPAGFTDGGDDRPRYTVAFFEENGLVGGNARTHSGLMTYFDGTAAGAQSRFPYTLNNDGLGLTAGQNQALYPPAQYMTRAIWRAQQATSAGSTKVNGFAVALGQQGYDDRVQNILGIANLPGAPVAPLSLRTPVGRAQLTGAGSGAEWWRPDIPLALLGATLGPAQCHELAHPITLHPGDVLEADLVVPGATDFSSLQGGAIITPTYQMGISFLGYSAIEG